MAVRSPIKIDGSGNLVTMNATEIAQLKTEMGRQYGISPSVTLTVGTGNLTTISDTRLRAGASSTSIGNDAADDTQSSTDPLNYVPEATTAEPTIVTVNYNLIAENLASLTLVDSNNRKFPLYYDSSGNLSAMTITDMYDTFVNDVINTLTTAGTGVGQSGTYRIHTADSLIGHTLVSGTPVFLDTRADSAAYTSIGIPETIDQPKTVNSYYLFKINEDVEGTIPAPAYIRSDNDIQAHSTASIQSLLSNTIRYYATQTGSKIVFGTGTSSTGARGSGMVDTRLNGSAGLYTTYYAGVDDYRSQEFPYGAPITINTYYLTCTRG